MAVSINSSFGPITFNIIKVGNTGSKSFLLKKLDGVTVIVDDYDLFKRELDHVINREAEQPPRSVPYSGPSQGVLELIEKASSTPFPIVPDNMTMLLEAIYHLSK